MIPDENGILLPNYEELVKYTIEEGIVTIPEVNSLAEEFSDWFVQQNFQGQEYHQWVAVLSSLIDGIDRSREAHGPIVEPVYVAILTGTKYHSTESCPALKRASRVLELDLTEAQKRGFEACSRCD